jgi:hypothetical protein
VRFYDGQETEEKSVLPSNAQNKEDVEINDAQAEID